MSVEGQIRGAFALWFMPAWPDVKIEVGEERATSMTSHFAGHGQRMFYVKLTHDWLGPDPRGPERETYVRRTINGRSVVTDRRVPMELITVIDERAARRPRDLEKQAQITRVLFERELARGYAEIGRPPGRVEVFGDRLQLPACTSPAPRGELVLGHRVPELVA